MTKLTKGSLYGVQVRLIWAQSHNGVIGRAGTMPWHCPADLKHFKRMTAGHAVLMGRKTWESLPPAFRPLPGRLNLVMSRDKDFDAPGALVLRDEQALVDLAQQWKLHSASAPAVLWVIGGAQLYEWTLPWADELYVTQLELEVPGDAYAPAINADLWTAELLGQEPSGSFGVPACSFWRHTRR